MWIILLSFSPLLSQVTFFYKNFFKSPNYKKIIFLLLIFVALIFFYSY